MIKGDGKNGKRLWIRTSDHRWIEIPYGPGQDSKIKSLNFYHSTHGWMSPAWGRTILENRPSYTSDGGRDLESVLVYAPGRTWDGKQVLGGYLPYFNPNIVYGSTGDSKPWYQYRTAAADWIKLFMLRPRPDPNWRIVPLVYPYVPSIVPNRTVGEDPNGGTALNTASFWPSVSYWDQADQDVLEGEDTPAVITTGTVDDLGGRPITAWAEKYRSAVPQTDTESLVTSYGNAWSGGLNNAYTRSILIDLAAIRDRLEQDYEYEGFDHTSSYYSIKNQSLRRVIIRANVWARVRVITQPGVRMDLVEDDVLGGGLTIYWKNGVLSNTVSVSHNISYGNTKTLDLHVPRSGPGGAGTELMTIDATDYNISGSQEPDNTIMYGDHREDVTWVLDAPGENNVLLFADITGALLAGNESIKTNWSSVRIQLKRVTLQYASENHDVPSDLQDWDVLY